MTHGHDALENPPLSNTTGYGNQTTSAVCVDFLDEIAPARDKVRECCFHVHSS